jgi:hypothetical protein
MSNPIEQYIQIQRDYGGYWRGWTKTPEQIQHAFVEIARLRTEHPARKYRLVSIAITLLCEEQVST